MSEEALVPLSRFKPATSTGSSSSWESPFGGPQLPPDVVLQVPADDLCLAHVMVAAKDALPYARGRQASGYVIGDPARVAADADTAKTMKDLVFGLALEAGDDAAADRLQKLGCDGWMEESDLKHYAKHIGGTIQIVKPSEPNCPLHFLGSGPLAFVVGHVPTKDGAGQICDNHWALIQTYFKPPCASGGSSGHGQGSSGAGVVPVGGGQAPAKRARTAVIDVDAAPAESIPAPASPTTLWEPLEIKELFESAGAISFEPEAVVEGNAFAKHLEDMFEATTAVLSINFLSLVLM